MRQFKLSQNANAVCRRIASRRCFHPSYIFLYETPARKHVVRFTIFGRRRKVGGWASKDEWRDWGLDYHRLESCRGLSIFLITAMLQSWTLNLNVRVAIRLKMPRSPPHSTDVPEDWATGQLDPYRMVRSGSLVRIKDVVRLARFL